MIGPIKCSEMERPLFESEEKLLELALDLHRSMGTMQTGDMANACARVIADRQTYAREHGATLVGDPTPPVEVAATEPASAETDAPPQADAEAQS